MNVGILIINHTQLNGRAAIAERLLFERGYDVKQITELKNEADVGPFFEAAKKSCNAVLVCGDIDVFLSAYKLEFGIRDDMDAFEINDVIVALSKNCEIEFVREKFVPLLNSRCKTFYTTAVFKTFDKTEGELRELLKEYIKNRNRIAFYFYPSPCECEVLIRYSTKTSKPVVDDILRNVHEKLQDCLYALKDISLEQQVAELLRIRAKKLKIAESFTGGGIASALVEFPGASEYLQEAVVSYSNASKISRLNVEKQLIDSFGAVSIEVVYEMAANLLMTENCDIAVATSGNAGPTSEKPDQVGVCFIAVGDMHGIHIYKYDFKGSRKQIIQSGIKTALFRLYKKLRENDFEQLIKEQQNI